MTKQIWKSDNGQQMTQYHLTTEQGAWLAEVFMQPDGFIFIKSDWGDFSYRFCFNGTFENFILSLEPDYFAGKVYQQWNYINSTHKVELAAKRLASHVLPVLQEAIRESQCNDISAL